MQEPMVQLTTRTLEVWQPRASRALNREDARQIIENATGFFRVLLEWLEVERQAPSPPPPAGR